MPRWVYDFADGSREMRDLLGSDVEPVYEAPRPGDIMHSLADLSLARAELGYEPTVQLREGLQRTIQHFREEELPGQADLMFVAHDR